MLGTFAWATGVGKSREAILCVQEIETRFPKAKGLWVAPTESMRDVDWPAEFANWGYTPKAKLICYASLSKMDLYDYDYYVFDECHRLTIEQLTRLDYLKKTKPIMAIGLTATFPKIKHASDSERVLLMRSVLPPVSTITTDQAVDMGLIRDFSIFTLLFELDKVNKNIKSGTKAKPFVTTEANQYAYLTKRLQQATISNNEKFKVIAAANRVKFMYNLPSRTRLAKELLTKMQKENVNKRILVFGGSIDQITDICGSDFVYHSKSSDEALHKFQSMESNLLGSVQALNEGKNLAVPDDALLSQINAQERNLTQRIGRLLRLRDTETQDKANIVITVAKDTCDQKWYDQAIEEFQTTRIKVFNVVVPPIV